MLEDYRRTMIRRKLCKVGDSLLDFFVTPTGALLWQKNVTSSWIEIHNQMKIWFFLVFNFFSIKKLGTCIMKKLKLHSYLLDLMWPKINFEMNENKCFC